MVWLLSDHLWERWMERARGMFKAGALDDAGALWRAASDMAQTFADDDPRRAASLDALATFAAGSGDGERAAEFYGRALERWSAAGAWVARMDVAQAARSSMFHLRLESKHTGAYPEIGRARHVKTLAAGAAGTEANLAFLTTDPDAMDGALNLRRAAFGRREAGAAAMAGALGQIVEERIIDRWSERPPQRFDDERRLYAAALLAPIALPTPDEL
jgi:hypothetical protein